MKHVWILNHYALEPSSSGGTRHFDLARNLRAHGWQATVIAASVEHPNGRQRLAPDEHLRHDLYSDVPFLWIRTPEYKGNGVRRILNMLAYSWRVLVPAYTRDLPKPDVVIGSSVHPLAALCGLLLARRHGVPFAFEVRDLWPQTLIDFGYLRKNSVPAWVLRSLEKLLYRHAARIVVLLPRAADYIVSMGISKDKVVCIPNGVDLSAFPAFAPSQQEDGEPFVLMYLGSHGQSNALHNVLQAMHLVSRRIAPESIKLRMIGNGPLKPELIRLAQQLELRNVSFEPAVPKSTIPALAGEADAFVISIPDLPQLYRYGISPNKLFDYLAAARPILFTANAANNPVEDSGAGSTVMPGNPQALADAILALVRLPPEERHDMGRSGRRYVEMNHGFDRLAERLASTLDACVKSA